MPVVTENLVCMLTLSAGETDQDTGVAAVQGVLDLKAGSAEKNPAWLATKLLWFIRRTEAIVSEDRVFTEISVRAENAEVPSIHEILVVSR
jgi:hypothetical protein